METEIQEPEKRTKRTEAELRKIAWDMADGKIFTSSQVSDGMLDRVFMTLMFGGQESIDYIKREKVAMLFQYISEAAKRDYGHYVFFSHHYIYEDEVEDLQSLLKEAKEHKETWLNPTTQPVTPPPI